MCSLQLFPPEQTARPHFPVSVTVTCCHLSSGNEVCKEVMCSISVKRNCIFPIVSFFFSTHGLKRANSLALEEDESTHERSLDPHVTTKKMAQLRTSTLYCSEKYTSTGSSHSTPGVLSYSSQPTLIHLSHCPTLHCSSSVGVCEQLEGRDPVL